MNQLEQNIIKINIESMTSSQVIDALKHKLKYIPLELDFLELGIKEREVNKQVLAVEELEKDLTILKIMGEALRNKYKEKSLLIIPLDQIQATDSENAPEHEIQGELE